jgi:putative FmdB family regulatory protein
MIYDYRCYGCEKDVEVIKPMSECSRRETCPDCLKELSRLYRLGHSQKVLKTDFPYFHHGLGHWVDGDRHGQKIAKQRGLIEVGNERQETFLKPHREEYTF